MDAFNKLLAFVQGNNKAKRGAGAPLRFTNNITAKLSDNLLRNVEAEAYAAGVELLGGIDEAKQLK